MGELTVSGDIRGGGCNGGMCNPPPLPPSLLYYTEHPAKRAMNGVGEGTREDLGEGEGQEHVTISKIIR